MRPLSTVARGGTVAASGLLCHATIAEQQLAAGRYQASPPRYTSSQGSLRPPSPSLGRARLISHLANNVLFPNRPNSPKPFFFDCRPSKFVLCSNFHVKYITKTSVTGLRFSLVYCCSSCSIPTSRRKSRYLSNSGLNTILGKSLPRNWRYAVTFSLAIKPIRSKNCRSARFQCSRRSFL